MEFIFVAEVDPELSRQRRHEIPSPIHTDEKEELNAAFYPRKGLFSKFKVSPESEKRFRDSTRSVDSFVQAA